MIARLNTKALQRGVLALALAFTYSVWGAPSPTNATQHWAFQPITRSAIPARSGKAAPRTVVDNFIFAELTKRKLTPSPEADRATLIRRLHFDLIGLPPSPAEIAAFVVDDRPNAYEQIVERLLASPQYGERWGRHWLDAAGYADSNGYFDADSDRPLAWKYRDYVVRSVSGDKSFDQFVREQIAGDELAGYDPNGDVTGEKEELLVATHFLRNTPDGTGESDGNAAELRVDRYSVLEGTVHLLGSVFMGMTVQCARCHDHKFEPLRQAEYYSLQAILRPAYDPDHWLKPKDRLITAGARAEREKRQAAIDASEREIKATKESIDGLLKPFRKLIIDENLRAIAKDERTKVEKALETKEKDRSKEMKDLLKKHEKLVEVKDEAVLKRFAELTQGAKNLEASLKKREQEKPTPLPQISALFEPTNSPTSHFVLVRGNYAKPGAEVQPGIPAAFASPENPFTVNPAKTGSTGRRLALARWLTSTNNPVVARLAVNRVWQHHFGTGLVPTVDNFGVTGSKPTHPELLDYLASEFIRNGWELKPLHRLIVNSATYRQSSVLRESANKIDPDNHLLWRFPMQRIDSESIRDAMLAVTGELDSRVGGPFVAKDKTEEGQYVIVETKPDARRRSIYLQQRRTTPVGFVDLFDGAKMNPNCVQRTSSTVALQSLALLNSEFVRVRSKAFATRLCREAVGQDERLELAFRLAVGRSPTKDERDAAVEFLRAESVAEEPAKAGTTNTAEASGTNKVAKARVADDSARWTNLCQMIFASNTFLFVE